MNQLFRQVDISSLVFFRIFFGILAFADCLGVWIHYHLMKNYFDADAFHFRYYGFEWVQVFPEPFMSLFFWVLMILGLMIAFGYRYKTATLCFAFGFTYLFLCEKGLYLNHGYLFCHLSFVMFFLPAHRAFSVDVLRKPQIRLQKISFWPVFLLCFLMGVVYFYGGIAKINSDWLRAVPMQQWLGYKSKMPIIGSLLKQEWFAWFISYGGLFFDLFVVFFLLFRRTRLYAFAAVVFFHTVNFILFKIGIFPFLSLAFTAMFFPPDFPKKIIAWLGKRIRKVRILRVSWYRKLKRRQVALLRPVLQYTPAQKKTILYVLTIYIAVHLLLPFRHHLFPGDVAWTEEGHRYSWRMMLRGKQGYGSFNIVNSDTKESISVTPKKYLNAKLERKLYTHPDMILQFAHFLRDEYSKKKDWKNIEVYANIRTQLNYRGYAQYIDPGVDLAKEKWHFFKSEEWILPYEK